MNEPKLALRGRIQPGQYTVLLFALITLLFIYPVFATLASGQFILDVMFTALLIIGAFATRRQMPRLFRQSVLVGVAGIAANWLAYLVHSDIITLISYFLLAAFFAFEAALILVSVLRGSEVSLDKLQGAICAYMLIGLMWGMLYCCVELVQPNSFHFVEGLQIENEVAARGLPQFPSLIYLSFVTLTTLGFGDVTPVTPFSRMLCLMEAICGQFYLAIFVARLVGLHLAKEIVQQIDE